MTIEPIRTTCIYTGGDARIPEYQCRRGVDGKFEQSARPELGGDSRLMEIHTLRTARISVRQRALLHGM